MSTDHLTTSQSVQYRIVPGEPAYRVDSEGGVWTCATRASKGKGTGSGSRVVPGATWRLLKPYLVDGHHRVTLRGKMRFVHRLVLEAFVGPCPEGMECCHNDGNAINNRVENLRWDTRRSNLADQALHGVLAKGETNGRSKMTEVTVRAIRARYARGGISLRALGDMHGVDNKTIHAIVIRRTWQHVD